MQRLPILLVNRDPAFLEDEEHVIERRGCELHVAATVEEVRDELRANRFVMGVVNGLSARMSPASVLALHEALRRGLPIPLIVVAPSELAEPLRAAQTSDLHVLNPPLKHRYLLDLSSRLIGVGVRRSVSLVVQLYLEDAPGTLRMGFMEDISRHGMLVRLDHALPEDAVEGVASFMIPGSKMTSEVRIERRRMSEVRGSPCYGFEFTQITRETYDAVAHFLKG